MNRDKNRDVSSGVTASYFILWRMIRKDWCERCRAFPERVCPRILSLESVKCFGTSEYFSESFDGEAINWSGVVRKLSFYASESCGLFLAMIEMTRHVHRVFGLWQWCNSSGIVFRVFIHAYSIIVEYEIKRKYPEEYPTVDKVGSKKREEILFRVELVASSFLM